MIRSRRSTNIPIQCIIIAFPVDAISILFFFIYYISNFYQRTPVEIGRVRLWSGKVLPCARRNWKSSNSHIHSGCPSPLNERVIVRWSFARFSLGQNRKRRRKIQKSKVGILRSTLILIAIEFPQFQRCMCSLIGNAIERKCHSIYPHIYPCLFVRLSFAIIIEWPLVSIGVYPLDTCSTVSIHSFYPSCPLPTCPRNATINSLYIQSMANRDRMNRTSWNETTQWPLNQTHTTRTHTHLHICPSRPMVFFGSIFFFFFKEKKREKSFPSCALQIERWMISGI